MVGKYFSYDANGVVVANTTPRPISSWVADPHYVNQYSRDGVVTNAARFSTRDGYGDPSGNVINIWEEHVFHICLNKCDIVYFFNPYKVGGSPLFYQTDPAEQYAASQMLDELLIEFNDLSDGMVKQCMNPDPINWQATNFGTCAKLANDEYLWRISSKTGFTQYTVSDSNGSTGATFPQTEYGFWYGPVASYDAGITYSFS